MDALFLIFDITADKFNGFKYRFQTLVIMFAGNQVVEILTGSKSNPAIYTRSSSFATSRIGVL